ncbi:RNase P/MRP, p29 subunit [Rickenella mellea]|uniref:Ribonuclease P protein subunit n=1 Tax=Rickenella mellea TaxID=50990 RepID=A0A4Y7QCY9_9AGAM|nr:RNase P/MRP, p29 subunit [Rickenella mellea]
MDAYKDLPLIKNERCKLSSESPFTPTFVQSHLAQSSNLNPQVIYASRIKDKHIPLENPPRESRETKARNEKRLRRKAEKERARLGIVGRREAAMKGLWKLDPCQAKYHLFLPLHNLWLGYMSELLGLAQVPSVAPSHIMPNSAGMHAKLIKADFHGCIMSVKQSKNPSLVGLTGIVVHETENAFKVVTADDKVKLLPKQNSIFTFCVPLYAAPQSGPEARLDNIAVPSAPGSEVPERSTSSTPIPQMQFELYGNQFRFRSADRAGRKFKHKETIEL